MVEVIRRVLEFWSSGKMLSVKEQLQRCHACSVEGRWKE